MALALNFLLPLRLLPMGTQHTTQDVLKSWNEMWGLNPTTKPTGGKRQPVAPRTSSPLPLPRAGKITPYCSLGPEVPFWFRTRPGHREDKVTRWIKHERQEVHV